MFKTFKRLFQPSPLKRYCPFCGTQFVEWIDRSENNGYIVERNWVGCPIYRNKAGNFSEWSKHGASWSQKGITSHFDPYTGQKVDDNTT